MKEAAVISMGTEVSDHDMLNIKSLCDQVIALSEYRGQLFDYLRSRMNAIAPNLTVMVGELVGARLIAHAGSLINLAKHPASTVQILGAEKVCFQCIVLQLILCLLYIWVTFQFETMANLFYWQKDQGAFLTDPNMFAIF
jgi:RNA processing factor Prp31